MIAQAVGLALLSALSPTALLIAAVYLGSTRPGLTSMLYLAGAVVMSLVMGVILVLVLRSAGLNHPDQHAARYGLRLGLGLVLLAAGLVLAARRKLRPPDPARAGHGVVARMVADPAPLSAFLVGLLVFAPGVTFIAALQVIATAQASPELTALAVILVVVINVLLVWLPITLHLVAPKRPNVASKLSTGGCRRMEARFSSACWPWSEGSWSSTAFTGWPAEDDPVPAADGRASGGPTSPMPDDFPAPAVAILGTVDPRDRLRSVGKRMTDPVEPLAQRIAERAIDLVVNALDVNALVARVDLNAVLDHLDLDEVLKKLDVNALLERVDLNALLDRVDLNPLLDRMDVNDLVRRIDMDGLVEETDLGAIIAKSSGGVASEALDAARSQAVGLDQFIDRWVRRLLRRKQPGPPAPPALLDAKAQS